ncbi:MAG: VWA domain-containing protein [Acidobacteria bacterium]|nr:VWA domain-containing protein [Acidobacteriota bacterium]
MPLLSRIAAVLFCPALVVLMFAQDDTATFRADTRLVVLHASVLDKKDRLITDLKRESFKVYENGVEQQVNVFRREDIPISLGLIVDNSGSMREKRQRVEAAALALVKASNPQDEVFIVNFNDEAFLDVPFTNDIKKMEEGIARIDSRGGTAMRDAVSGAIDEIKAHAKKDKKVLLVITDGNDNTSTMTLEKLVQKANDSDIPISIYSIGLLNEEEKREAKKAERSLNALTKSSGGLAYYPKLATEVNAIALKVAHEIRNQYILAYTPSIPALDGTFRQIRVQIQGNRGLQVRTRTGYFATPEGARRSAGSQAQR